MVLAIVMLVATLLLVALTAAVTSVYQEGQREREEELIFRGTQYAQAVALFHRKFSRYPVSVKELLQTNGMRFLRKEYPDPMDPKGKWRFIHINAAGVLLDSKNQTFGTNPNNTNPAGLGGGNSSTNSTQVGGFSMGNSNPMGQSTMGGTSGFGMTQPVGSSQTGPTSSFFGNQNEIQGAYIAGVAATSHHESIKIWQKHHHYDEWEFTGLDRGVFGIQIGMPTVSTPGFGGQQTNSQGSGFSQGSSGSTTPPSSFGPTSN